MLLVVDGKQTYRAAPPLKLKLGMALLIGQVIIDLK
jgi:hypothetical protein